jgi:nitroimidazol reductase NimA-like FMN-containing flavoprotein (pyridoxamine 5'-phosphate oxidase superfamily)
MESANAGAATKVLGVHDCWECLRSASVGRLAVVTAGGVPEIFPVNYLPEDGTLIFRTAPGTKVDAMAAGGVVAMEADGLNVYGTIAWSVVIKGLPEIVDMEGRDLGPGREPAPWEEGTKDLVVRITPTEITGRRFAVTSAPSHWWQPRTATTPAQAADPAQ